MHEIKTSRMLVIPFLPKTGKGYKDRTDAYNVDIYNLKLPIAKFNINWTHITCITFFRVTLLPIDRYRKPISNTNFVNR